MAGRMAVGCFGYLLLGVMWFFATARVAFLPIQSRFVGWICITIALLGLALWLRIPHQRLRLRDWWPCSGH